MYSLEQLKVLIGFMLFSLIGRLLFYRERHRNRTFGDKVKIRFMSWFWEIPVLLFFGLMGLGMMERWDLTFTEAGLASLGLAYFGLEALKIWFYDWFNAKIGKKPKKEKDDD